MSMPFLIETVALEAGRSRLRKRSACKRNSRQVLRAGNLADLNASKPGSCRMEGGKVGLELRTAARVTTSRLRHDERRIADQLDVGAGLCRRRVHRQKKSTPFCLVVVPSAEIVVEPNRSPAHHGGMHRPRIRPTAAIEMEGNAAWASWVGHTEITLDG